MRSKISLTSINAYRLLHVIVDGNQRSKQAQDNRHFYATEGYYYLHNGIFINYQRSENSRVGNAKRAVERTNAWNGKTGKESKLVDMFMDEAKGSNSLFDITSDAHRKNTFYVQDQ